MSADTAATNYVGMVIHATSSAALMDLFIEYVGDQRSSPDGVKGTLAVKPGIQFMPNSQLWTRESAKEDCMKTNNKPGPAFAYDIGDTQWYLGGWCSL